MPLLPGVDGRGRPWRDHRQVINRVLWRLRTGAPWRDVPERYGPWKTVYERFARWEAAGTWARLLQQVQVRDDAVGAVEWTVSVDSTVNRAHQHAAGAREKGGGVGRTGISGTLGSSPGARPVPRGADHQGSSRLRRQGPSPGRRRHAGQYQRLHRLRHRHGRAASAPDRCRTSPLQTGRGARGHGVLVTGDPPGPAPAFDRELYKARNVVERCFGRLKQFRAIATRFDKLAHRYRAGVHLASLILWLRATQDPLPDKP